VRQLEEANRQDERIDFDLFRKWSLAKTDDARNAVAEERLAITRRKIERARQLPSLREQISKLEAELVPANAGK
jgi:hypothetical protein